MLKSLSMPQTVAHDVRDRLPARWQRRIGMEEVHGHTIANNRLKMKELFSRCCMINHPSRNFAFAHNHDFGSVMFQMLHFGIGMGPHNNLD